MSVSRAEAVALLVADIRVAWARRDQGGRFQ
jgi:hypothetical protein